MTRLLVVRLGSLGDIVHALPAVAALRDAFPDARLDWLVEERWGALVELVPGVSNVISVDIATWRRQWYRRRTWRGFSELVRTLRTADYNAAVDFQGLYKSALLARFSGAPRRFGFEKGYVKEAGAARFYTERVRPPENAHVIHINLELARRAVFGRASASDDSSVRFPLALRAEDEAYVEELLRSNHLREFFILSPGGGWGSKCWPLERYTALHAALARERGWRSVLNAGPGEEQLVSEFMAEARVTRPVHFPLTLGQLACLVRRARVLVSGDTGPLHLAAALGTPVVGLYGPTDPVRNGPYGPRTVALHHREQARITYKHERKTSPALLAITVEEVLAAVRRLLETPGG